MLEGRGKGHVAPGAKLPVSTLASIAILLAATGCADFHPPRIDPSGEHLFISDSPPPAAVPCPPGTVPTPAPAAPAVVAPAPIAPAPVPAVLARPPVTPLPRVSPYSDVAAMLSPFRTVQPVGSQVVMLGGVRGGDGYLRTNRRLEWWLMPGSVGQFTAIGENSFTNYLVGDFTRPRLTSATSAVGSTTRVDQWVGGPGNKVHVARGQGWVTVSSPVEGVSHVTVVAPDVVLPAERAKSAVIYWIDAQFGLPTPAIIPAGTKQSLTTTVWRQSNHGPRPGWIVRYETACGPPAVFAPAGTPSIEAVTNEAGQASVEIVEKDPSPGTSQVRVQVFRPADKCGERQLVREASVLVTWTAPSLGIRQMGPPTVVVGETVTYRIEVSNPGDLPARDVVASEEVPAGLTFRPGQSGAGGRRPPLAMAARRFGPTTTANNRSDFSHHTTGDHCQLRRSHGRRRAAIESLCKHECPRRDARPRHDAQSGQDTGARASPDAGGHIGLGDQGHT